METLSLTQGSQQWLAHRAKSRNASDAAAVLNCSPYMKRQELLRIRHTGISPEVDAMTQRRFDSGHVIEAKKRPVAEAIFGQDLYPVVGQAEIEGLLLSASFDGLTMLEDGNWECKSLNADLREALPFPGPDGNDAARLPKFYRVQMEQQCAVAGCERILFTASDGENDDRHCWYYPDPALRAELIAAWRQFDIDLANYSPAETAAAAVAAPMDSLPAVLVQMRGELSVTSNLEEFGGVLKAFIAKLPKQPTTDNEFATADAACKALARAEKDLKSEEDRALSGMSSVESMRRLVADLHKTARDTRLALEKLVDKRKRTIKEDECKRGEDTVLAHIRQRNEQLGGDYLPLIERNFPGCIARLKSFDSLRGAIDDHVAEVKIKVDAHFATITQNLTWLRLNAAELKFLFSDVRTLVLKPHADFCDLCTARIDNHKAEVSRKEAAERERQEAEVARRMAAERERLEREAVAREQAAAEATRRELLAEQDRQRTMKYPSGAPMYGQTVKENGDRIMLNEQGGRSIFCDVDEEPEAPATVVQATFAPPAQPEKPVLQLVPAGPPSMNLSQINARIAPLGITVSGLEALGFPVAAQAGAAKLFHAADFDHMVRAMADHLMQCIKSKEAA